MRVTAAHRLLLIAGFCLFLPAPVGARAVLDPSDPAFAGSVTETLVPPPGATVFQLVSNGVTFTFTSQAWNSRTLPRPRRSADRPLISTPR